MYSIFTLPHDFLDREYTQEEKDKYDKAIDAAISAKQYTLSEALTPEQENKVKRWKMGYDAEEAHRRVFGDNDRIVVPYDDSNDEKITSTNYTYTPGMRNGNAQSRPHHHHVFERLHKAGYRIDDYGSGLTAHKDTPDRKIKIRKAMSLAGITDSVVPIMSATKYETDEHGAHLRDEHGEKIIKTPGRMLTLGETYDADPVRAAITKPKQIVFTKNKYDVAGMSTDRGWHSCMNMVDGENAKYLPQDIHHGTITAYLTHKGDDEVTKPIGRINLKKFDSGLHKIYRPENSAYGTTPDGFKKQVDEWAEKNYESRPGVYVKASSLYNDDGQTLKYEKFDKIDTSDVIRTAPHIARDILQAYGNRHDHDGDDDDFQYDDDRQNEIKEAAVEAIDQMHKHVSDKDYSKSIIHFVSDHSDDHNGDKQEPYESNFHNEHIEETTGHDAAHHWALDQTRVGPTWRRFEAGVKSMSAQEIGEGIGKVHAAMKHSEDGDHPVLKEVHATLIHHAFSHDAPELHSTILHHMIDPTNQDYHESLMKDNTTIMDSHHPMELTHNPRMMHSIFHADHSHFTNSDPFTHETMYHVGKHADAKLAHDVLDSHDMTDDARRGLIKGLNDNPKGEGIQHKMLSGMLLSGGSYHGKGDIKDIHTPMDLRMAMQGQHRTHPYGISEDDEPSKIADIANHTKFPSVLNAIKKRAAPGGDYDHPMIHDGIKYNRTAITESVAETPQLLLKDFVKVARQRRK